MKIDLKSFLNCNCIHTKIKLVQNRTGKLLFTGVALELFTMVNNKSIPNYYICNIRISKDTCIIGVYNEWLKGGGCNDV